MQLVGLVHLLQEDEGEDCVRAEAEVVRSEAFPQGEETLNCEIRILNLFMNWKGQVKLWYFESNGLFVFIGPTRQVMFILQM